MAEDWALRQRRTDSRKEKRKFTSVANEVWSYDISHILMPAHVIELTKRLTGNSRGTKTLKRWLYDEFIVPPEIMEVISNNKIPRGKDINTQRQLLIELIYDKLKNNCNEV